MNRSAAITLGAIAILLLGSVAFAASAPFLRAPGAADLPVIAADMPLESAAGTLTPSATPTLPVSADASADSADDEAREVITVPVRDEDTDSDDDGESDERDGNQTSHPDPDSTDSAPRGEESSKTD